MGLGGRISLKAVAGAVAVSAALCGQALAIVPFTPDPESPLSSRLQQLAGQNLRSASAADQAEAIGLPARGPGSISRDGGDAIVEVRVSGRTRARVDGLTNAGADVIGVSPHYRVITATVAERDLRDLARSPGVASVTEVLTPITSGRAAGGAATSISTCTGSVVTEGDAQLQAALARTQYNVDGNGVKVGVLSDSYNALGGEAADVASGDLPGPGNPCGRTTPVQILQDSGGADEGRAMAQLVHDLAPGANLAFATAFTGEFNFAANIEALATAGSKVIVDDVTYFDEPFFQDGPVSVAVNHVTGQGVTYYSSAANSNATTDANRIASWETPSFRDGGACPGVVPGLHCLDFDPGAGVDTTFGITVAANRTVSLDLQWAEPQGGVTTNLDAYVRDGVTITDFSNDVNPTTQLPFEFVSLANTTGANKTFTVSIPRVTAAGTPRVKWVLFGGPSRIVSTEYPTGTGGDIVGPTIFGHNGAGNAMSTAAVPYFDSSTVENFSSRGPVTLYFDSVEAGFPAPPLGAPLVLAKPDISATDGGLTTFFGGGNRFFGTSAAAPHAAAVAALQLDANPAQSVAQIKAAQLSTAVPVTATPSPSASGAGLVNALGAVPANPPAPPSVTVQSPGTTGDSTPSIPFTINGDPKTITCAVDGGAAQACGSPFTPATKLADGNHTLAVNVTDFFGGAGSGSGAFKVDTKGPKVEFTKKPKKRSTKRKAKFKFISDPAGATFECSLDGAKFKPCKSPFKAKVKPGKHTLEVRAIDSFGNTGPVEKFKWKVKP
ncbi:MAG: S8 family serine peptidase [Vicinamibacteria bacterium]